MDISVSLPLSPNGWCRRCRRSHRLWMFFQTRNVKRSSLLLFDILRISQLLCFLFHLQNSHVSETSDTVSQLYQSNCKLCRFLSKHSLYSSASKADSRYFCASFCFPFVQTFWSNVSEIVEHIVTKHTFQQTEHFINRFNFLKCLMLPKWMILSELHTSPFLKKVAFSVQSETRKKRWNTRLLTNNKRPRPSR